jgi:hypothetical protein
MHQKEFSFKDICNIPDESLRKLGYLFAQTRESEVGATAGLNLSTLDFSMWNAGVIGIPVKLILPLFEQVYSLTRYIYQFSEHHTSEQLAFSIILQRNGELIEANRTIYHYWNEFEKESVNNFLEKNISKLNKRFEQQNLSKVQAYFEMFPAKIRNSYIFRKHQSLELLRNNLFIQGYQKLLLAVLKNPTLDREYRQELNYHIFRHIKHLIKTALGKYNSDIIRRD